MDKGIVNAAKQAVLTPLPVSWLDRPDAATYVPNWATISALTTTQTKNLQAQIAYDLSGWNYNKIGDNNKLGRYQFTTDVLETYGLLVTGSNQAYGTDCVNRKNCWQQNAVRRNNSYGNYLYNIASLSAFLASTVAQDHLNYQMMYDTYNELSVNNGILAMDSADVVAGMIYVGITLGAGQTGDSLNPSGSGAWAWRYWNLGQGTPSYNAGRYAATVLSQ